MGKIVNAHVHFGLPWGPSPHLDVSYTPETLLRDMDRDGVDMSIILPFIFNYDMEWHARCAREHPDRLIAYAMFNPWRHPAIKDDIRRNVADDAIRVAQRNKNVILDQTAASSQQLRDALAAIEPERIIWGSDSPYMDERVELEKIRVGVEDPKIREMILGENVLNILGIK